MTDGWTREMKLKHRELGARRTEEWLARYRAARRRPDGPPAGWTTDRWGHWIRKRSYRLPEKAQ